MDFDKLLVKLKETREALPELTDKDEINMIHGIFMVAESQDEEIPTYWKMCFCAGRPVSSL